MRTFRSKMLFLSLVLLCETAWAQSAAMKAVKLYVYSSRQSIPIDSKADIEVTLQDGNNEVVRAPKDLPVKIEALWPSGRVEKWEATIKAGEATKKFQLPLSETGIVEIRASQRELLEGSIFIKVKPGVRAGPRSWIPGPSRQFASGAQVLLVQLSQSPRSPSPRNQFSLTLRYSPQRRLLADGKDRALIQAFLLSEEEAPGDIQVRLFNSGGTLTPATLVIPRGQDHGESTLTSTQVGTVAVEFMGSTPARELQGEKSLQIIFSPPITRFSLQASPPSISLVENCELIVQLLDDRGRPFETDEIRQISFAIDAGQGQVEPQNLSIQPNHYEGRTQFFPTWRGPVAISAFIPNLPTQTIRLQVTLPLWLMGLSCLGGLVGGYIAFRAGKGRKRWRMVTGVITGFLLYWAFIFGLLSLLPRAVILNPLSAFALSTLGGWLGTEIFSLILKRLGLAT